MFKPSIQGGGVVPLTANYEDYYDNETNQSSYSTTMNIGTAAVGRRVVVCVADCGNNANQYVTGVNINGSAADLHIAQNDSGGDSCVAIASMVVESGTTATVEAVLNAAADRLGMHTIAIYGSSEIDNTAGDNASPLTQSIGVSDGGVLIGATQNNSVATWTWTNLTEQADEAVGTGGSSSSVAFDDEMAASTVEVTSEPTALGANYGMALASFRPV